MSLPANFFEVGQCEVSPKVYLLPVLCLLSALACSAASATAPAPVASPSATSSIAPSAKTPSSFRDWRAMRDAGVVKQEHDYSCGLAALATYFTAYLNEPLSESNLLTVLQERGDDWNLPPDWREQGVSYTILMALAEYYGARGAGLAVTPERLMSLRVPAIVRLHVDGIAHFSVLRGIAANGRVRLADPSWGNRQFSHAGFLKLWVDPEQSEQVGTLLLLQDIQGSRRAQEDYFAIEPRVPLLRSPG